jgi:type II secretory ATPase GspE/PulE/Tfp pilus assembly ATPase PilB-like protein
MQDESGFLFWEDVFDPLPTGADVAEIAVRAMRLECDEIYIIPTTEWIAVRFYRDHKPFKSYRMHRNRLPELIENIRLFARLQRSGRRRAEEGSLEIKHEDHELSFFVRLVYTSVGERVYMRLLQYPDK